MSGSVLAQAVVTGLSVGAVYGLVGLGFTLVWSLVRVIAFAHGDLVVGAVLVGVLAVVGATPVATTLSAGDSVLLLVLALAAGALLSTLTYAVAVRPFFARPGRAADVTGWVAAGLTAGLAVRTGLGLALPAAAYAVPDPLHLDALTGSGVAHLGGGVTVPVRVLGVLVLGVVVGVLVEVGLVRSRLGRAMRAVADDPDAATLLGVPIERVVLVAFAVAGVLAGLAGVLDAPGRSLSLDAGVLLGLYGAAAALLGRLGSPVGALAGGLVLGVVQQLAVTWDRLGAEYADVVPLTLLVAVLALRPEGLRAPRRVPVE
jgi:branched-subunit amino acid ABC-type transport system permease component